MKILVSLLIGFILLLVVRGLFRSFPLEYFDLVADLSDGLGIDPLLVMALIKVESGFDEKAVSPAGAIGLMQIMPETAEWIAPELDPTDPVQNLEIGMRYLGYLVDRYGGDVWKALMAYNIGPASLEKGERRSAGERYVKRIKLYWLIYSVLYRSIL